MIRKISGKGGCQEITMEKFVRCLKTKLIQSIEKSNTIHCEKNNPKVVIPAKDYGMSVEKLDRNWTN